MVERLVWEALREGLDLMKEPGVITQYMQETALLDLAEAQKVEEAFQHKPAHLAMGYARKDNDFPLLCVTTAADDWDMKVIGDDGGMVSDPEDPDYGADIVAASFSMTINVMVYAQHPDVCLYLYHLAKMSLFAAKPYLEAQGLYDLMMSGADLLPDPAWVPAGLFVRRLSVSCKRQYTQTLAATKLGKAWKVRGMHIDRDGDEGQTVGNVKTLITVKADDEDDGFDFEE